MTPLLLNEPCMMLIVVGEFLSACLQVVHLFLVVFRSSSRLGRLLCSYEFAVQLHLGIALCITVGSGAIRAPLLAEVLGFSRFFWLLWVNAAFSFFGLALALCLSRPALLVDALLMGLCTPGAIGVLGAHWNIVALLDVSWFMFRGLSSIVMDVVWRSEELTGLSVAEALMGMPAGILVTGPSGGSAFMNASMRSSLEALGLPTDLGDLSGIWGELSRRGRGICAEAGALGVPAVSERGEESLLVDVADGRTLLFQRDAAGAKSSGEMILCLDVTESVAANKALVQTNRELEAAAAELRSCLADVDRAAEASAYLRMRSRVHDVVGQRLSILHRYLEMGKTDPASVAELERLLSSVMADLRQGSVGDAAAELDAVVSAFSLVGVRVVVAGELPRRREVAAAFVRVVREACTNSCRHAHAKQVFVKLECPEGPLARLTVTDDGTDRPAPVREGTGIPGMRREIESVGGALTVKWDHPFTVIAEVDVRGNVDD